MTKYEMDYTKDDLKALFEETTKNKILKAYTFIYLFIAVVLFFILIAATYFIDGKISFGNPLPYVVLAVFIVCAVIAMNKTMKKYPEKMYEQFMNGFNGGTITCTFSDDRMSVEDTDGQTSYAMYNTLEKAVETDNYFYIFIDSSSAQIVRKSALTEGSPEETRNFLVSVLADKYEDNRNIRR